MIRKTEAELNELAKAMLAEITSDPEHVLKLAKKLDDFQEEVWDIATEAEKYRTCEWCWNRECTCFT